MDKKEISFRKHNLKINPAYWIIELSFELLIAQN